MYSTNAFNVALFQTKLTSNSAVSRGGAASFYNSVTVVDEVSFEKNRATWGGGLYLLESLLDSSNCSYTDNEVFGTGSAIWMSQSKNSSVIFNTFRNNIVPKGRGVVHWESSTSGRNEPFGLSQTNIFLNESFFKFTSSPSSLKVFLSNQELNVSSILISTSALFLPTVEVRILDSYGQVNIEDNILVSASTNSLLNKCGESGVLTGDTKATTQAGLVKFDELSVVCAPQGHIILIFTAELSGEAVSTFLNVSFEGCKSGEYLKGGRCVECGLGTYSLSYRGEETKCHEGCPLGSSSCFRNTIKLESGWWRENVASSLLFQCPYGKLSCLGGNVTGDSLCGVGY
jgi:hypothetical protein